MYNLYHRPYYSRFNVHPPLPSQMLVLQHQQLLKEQALIERFAKGDIVLNGIEKATRYEAQIRQKQIRINQMIRRQNIIDQINTSRLSQMLRNDQIQLQELDKKIKADRYFLFSKQPLRRNSRYSQNLNLQQKRSLKQNQSLKHSINKEESDKIYRQGKENLYKSNGFQSRNKGFDVKNELGKEKQYNSVILTKKSQERPNISQNTAENPTPQQKMEIGKKDRRVSFNLDYTSFLPNHNRSLSSKESPEPLKPKAIDNIPNRTRQPQSPHSQANKSKKESVAERIQKRVQLSKKFRDSDWRTTKHEWRHLSSSFELESRLRDGLRKKINETPAVIQRYRIVVD